MDADRIVQLSPEAIRELIESQKVVTHPKVSSTKRREERRAFAGTVEVWLPEGQYGERHVLATLHNLSPNGLAMRTRSPIPTHTRLSLALHQPELSCYGSAIVRHCTSANVGYLVGVEFLFGQAED